MTRRRDGAKRKDSLRLRIASAAVLIPLTLAAVWIGGAAFAALVAFATILMAFEWARMIEREEHSRAFLALAAGATAAHFLAASGRFALAYACCAAAGALSYFLAVKGGERRWWMGAAAIYLLAPSVALVWLRNATAEGLAVTAMLFAVVWAADTGGYVGGRLVGGPKISPVVSPAKTWAGAVGGVIFGAAAGAGAATFILPGGSAAAYALFGAGLGFASILGDMVESAVKRIFGLKDMSALIPGHGGVLDRLDGMIFATTAMAIVVYFHSFAGG